MKEGSKGTDSGTLTVREFTSDGRKESKNTRGDTLQR